MAEMSLEQRQYLTAKFKEFIAAVHSSHESNLPVRTPYQWQIRKRGKPVAYPKKGRLDDLKQAFVAANPKPKGKKNLTVSDKEDEQNFLNEYPLAQTEGKARYLSSAARKQREVLKAPWVMALYLEINAIACNGDIKNSSEWKPQESEFVNWAVALHRFLVKEWGIDPSPALVGKYAPGIARPANNVSIQIIDADFKQRYSQQIRDDVVKLNPGFLQLPHRGFDGHIRVGSYKGESTSKAEEYVKARNSTLDNLLPIFELSPETVIFGGWDSTRSKNQLRIPSVMVGETYAILAEQEEDPVIHRAGGRIDPVGASVIVFKCLEKEDNKSRRRGARVEADNEHGGKDKIDFPHRVFRYRASEPEGHRVICMHVQDAEHAVIKSGDILILDDFERVFSTFTENVAIFDPEGSSTVEDVFNKCGSSIMVINDISLKPKEIEAFQHIQNM